MTDPLLFIPVLFLVLVVGAAVLVRRRFAQRRLAQRRRRERAFALAVADAMRRRALVRPKADPRVQRRRYAR